MRYIAQISESKHLVELQENGHTREVTLDDRQMTVDWSLVGDTMTSAGSGDSPTQHYSLLVGAASYEAYARSVESEDGAGMIVEVMIEGRPYRVTIEDERTQALASLAGGKHISGDASIRAPMPGLVVNVLAAPGSAVERGQTVVVLEAMKMENDLTSPRPGVVKSVRVQRGQTVNQGDVLAVVGDPEGEQAADQDDEE